MEWLKELFWGEGVAHSILIFAMVIAAGVYLGKFKIKGISLGITFVLFVSLLAGHLGLKIHPEVLHFMKEFGLILFVYSIGLQVGPGFIASFKKGGLKLNLLAASVVFLGAGITLIIYALTDVPLQTMVGIMSGAVTNTPGLGAAQQAYQDAVGSPDNTIAMGYAVAYPLAVVGIIASLIAMRYMFKVNLEKEERDLRKEGGVSQKPLELVSVNVENSKLFGLNIKELGALMQGAHFVVSRVLHKDGKQIEIAKSHSVLNEGDKILFITSKKKRPDIIKTIGSENNMSIDDWAILDKQLISKKLVVTNSKLNSRTITELNLRATLGVNITRIDRAGIELSPTPNLKIQMGDIVTAVGSISDLASAEKLLGNKATVLNEPHLVPIFVGIFLGVILGSVPIIFPGIPQPVKLGLAGGPLIVAILMSWLSTKYKFITYTTVSANLMLREIGICFFLACVGLSSGEGFVDTIVNGGYYWVLYGFVITVVPLLVVGIIARKIFKINYFTIMGFLAGSMTDPPALAYANSVSENSASAVSYATVYPLTMFLRVLTAQLLILLFL